MDQNGFVILEDPNPNPNPNPNKWMKIQFQKDAWMKWRLEAANWCSLLTICYLVNMVKKTQ